MTKADEIHERGKRLDEPCDSCCKDSNSDFTMSLYHTPWDDEPTEHYFCSEECQGKYFHENDFQYFTCDHCGRLICKQNPSNGWHIQVREWGNCRICLKCLRYSRHVSFNRGCL